MEGSHLSVVIDIPKAIPSLAPLSLDPRLYTRGAASGLSINRVHTCSSGHNMYRPTALLGLEGGEKIAYVRVRIKNLGICLL